MDEIRDKFNRPLRDLRVSVIDACNFRCSYCMPVAGDSDPYKFIDKPDRLTVEEIIRLLRIFISFGLSRVKITGGEPLLRKDLPELVRCMSELNGMDDLALTTIGYWLSKYAKSLKNAGLDRVNVSLDALSDNIFGSMNGRGISTQRILEGITAARAVGLDPVKVNIVVQKNVNDCELVDMARYFKGTGSIVRFIEYMDVGNRNGWQLKSVIPSMEIVRKIHLESPLIPVDENYRGEVAKRYRYADGTGEIGFITSVTEPFCGSCNRLRLSSDGKLYTCLFAKGGIDLRKQLRQGGTDEEIAALIKHVWENRDDRYSEERMSRVATSETEEKVEMYTIGG